MASSTASASTSAALAQDTRPQADPLPSKRGEIGFQEEIHGQALAQQEGRTSENAQLPARHPADRSPSPSPPTNAGEPAPGSSAAPTSPSTDDASSIHSTAKRSIIGFLKPKKVPKLGGVQLTTILPMVILILIIGGTIAGWVIAVNMLQKSTSMSGSSSIFIYVAFAIVVLAELILLERRVFQVRAERYAHKHPGEMLPTSLHRSASRQSAAMPIAPWHRPPLPTYAAALVQAGVGTGDVEDAVIAQPPPPAYGQTRGSMLLLQGYLRNSLRAQAREYEVDRTSRASSRSDRPVSFASHDGEWEERRDAERARRLEESLARLEEGRRE